MRKTYGLVAWRKPSSAGGPAAWGIKANPDVMIRLKRILPRVDNSQVGVVIVRDTEETCRDLDWILDRWPMEISKIDSDRIRDRAVKHQQRLQMVSTIIDGAQDPMQYVHEPALPPRPYQEQALALTRASGGLLLTDELGLGKTFTSLLSLADPTMRPALAVTLTGQLERQWVNQLAKFFPGMRAHLVKKGTPYDISDEDGAWPDLIVMNYAKLAGWADHLAGNVRTVIFDEVQELRRDKTGKYNGAAAVAAGAELVWGLSATPIYNYGGEMFNILDVIRPGSLGDRYEFGREWCGLSWGLDTKSRVKNPAAFRSYLLDEGLMLGRTREDVGVQLPEATLQEQFVDSDARALDEAKGNAYEIARLILAQNTSTQDRWKSAGELDWKMRQATGIAKAPFVAAFTKLLLESEEKILLLGWHRSVYDIWMDKLTEFNPVLYSGSESTNQKAAAFDRFINGDSRVLIMSLRSGAGLDGLQDACRTVVFGELDWSPGVHKQVIGRLHRPGQINPVLGYFCVSDQGSDPVMIDTLNVKDMQSSLIVSPDAPNVLADRATNGDHIRRLAEAIVNGRPAPTTTCSCPPDGGHSCEPNF